MDYFELQDNIQYLESLEEADISAISCYLNVAAPYRQNFNDQTRGIMTGLPREKKAALWETLGRIEVFLGTGIQSGSKGVAVFGRGGKQPFFLAMQFEDPFLNSVRLHPTPDLSLLLEFRNSMFVPVENGTGLMISGFTD